MSSVVIGHGFPQLETNLSDTDINETISKCGINQQIIQKSCGDGEIERSTLYVLMSIFSGVMLISFLLCWMIKDAPVKQLDTDFSYFSLAQKTIRFVKDDRRQLLLIPITFFSGNSASYIAGTFTFSFITCGFGPEWIGLIMISFGVTGTITSLSLGYLKSKIHRIFLFGFGFTCQLCLLLVILGRYIYPHPEHIEWLFIMAGILGMCDSIWQSSLQALYGTLFVENKEAAFSNRNLWRSLGSVLAYGYGHHLSVYTKTSILLAFLVFGFLCYIFVELIERKLKTKTKKTHDSQ